MISSGATVNQRNHRSQTESINMPSRINVVQRIQDNVKPLDAIHIEFGTIFHITIVVVYIAILIKSLGSSSGME